MVIASGIGIFNRPERPDLVHRRNLGVKQMERKVFRSRISVLVFGAIFLLMLMQLISMIFLINAPMSQVYGLVGIMLLVIILLRGIWYEVDLQKGLITIKMLGIPCRKIEIMNIISVEQLYNIAGAFAASVKRLNIRERNGEPYCLISPVREQEFLEMLTKQNPDIRINVDDKKAWYRVQDWDI